MIDITKLTLKEKIDMLKEHLEYLMLDKCEKVALLEFRSHAIWYLKGINGAAKVKNLICGAKTIDEILKILKEDEYGPVIIKEFKEKLADLIKKAGKDKKVTFELGFEELGFYNGDGKFVVEKGKFNVFVGTNCLDVQSITVSVI